MVSISEELIWVEDSILVVWYCLFGDGSWGWDKESGRDIIFLRSGRWFIEEVGIEGLFFVFLDCLSR